MSRSLSSSAKASAAATLLTVLRPAAGVLIRSAIALAAVGVASGSAARGLRRGR